MWLVTSKSPMLSKRDGSVGGVGVGFIDALCVRQITPDLTSPPNCAPLELRALI